jgi:hypothetical protein
MKSMLIAASVVGAAIAGLVLYSRSDSGSLKAKQLRDKARKMLLSGNGHTQRSSVQTMG